MKRPGGSTSLLALVVCIGLLVYLHFVSALWRRQRELQEESLVVPTFPVISLVRSPKVLYLDKAEYRIAIESTSDSTDLDNGTKRKEGGLSTEAVEGGVEKRPTFTEHDNIVSNAYYEANARSEGEADERIDQNSLFESPTKSLGSSKSKASCKHGNPIKHVVLLKTHNTGGNTLANIFYRYGDLNELNFALPKHRSYEYFWPLHFSPTFVDANFLNSTSPNLLINARYSDETMKALMKNAFFVAILRNPVTHFASVFHNLNVSQLLGLSNSSDSLKEFLSRPREHTLAYLRKEPRLDINFNMIKNGQFFDLGLKHKFYDDTNTIKTIISQLDKSVDFVLILEYLDESLVLLKRKLCWELDDVLYFRLNKGTTQRSGLGDEQKTQIKVWNKADTMLYEHFNDTLWYNIRQQDSKFWEEVHELRRKVRTVENDCVFSKEEKTYSDNLEVKLRTDISPFNQYLCEKMRMNEEEYILYLKKKIELKVAEQNQELRRTFPKKAQV